MQDIKKIFLICCTILQMLMSCSGIKYLPKGQYFLDENSIRISGDVLTKKEKRALETKLKEAIPFKENTKILGSRPGVWFYHIVGNPKEHSTVRQYIRRNFGKPPVFVNDLQPRLTTSILLTQLNNEGYFKPIVTYKKTTNQKKGSATLVYSITVERPYKIGDVSYDLQHHEVYQSLTEQIHTNSLLAPGQQYSVENLDAEIARIEKLFRDEGFFFFDRKYLIFEADSTNKNRTVTLTLKVNGEIPDDALRIYHYGSANIYCNHKYVANTSTLSVYYDTTLLPDVSIFYDRLQSTNNVSGKVISKTNTLKRGTRYSLNSDNITRQRFLDLGTFHTLQLKYHKSPSDSTLLIPNISLVTKQKKSLNSKLEFISKSNGTIGPVASITLTNCNTFGNAERFDLTLFGSYETQITNSTGASLNAFEAKVEPMLTIKKLILPFKVDEGNSRYLPTTNIKAGLNFQNRINYYNIASLSAAFGYAWRTSRSQWHEFYPYELNYVKTSNISDDFYQTLLLNPTLALSLQNQFIMDSRYSFSLNRQTEKNLFRDSEKAKSHRHPLFLKITAEQAGNLLELIIKNVTNQSERPYEIMGAPYAQYTKGDIDFRYYWQINEGNKVATNISTGVGYSYGNTITMPYIKQYSIGGASSLRAFPARSVGPGSYDQDDHISQAEDSVVFTDQYADIRMQANVEYRFDIHKVFKGALFIDAGNIWTLREDSVRVGSQFKFNEFYKQLAIGTGFGIRFDFEIILVRFDTGVALRRPDDGWIIQDFDISDPAWRRENIIFNIGIGYPF